MKKTIYSILFWLVILVLPHIVLCEEVSTITITSRVNTNQCSVGDTITLSFEVTGGSGEYKSVDVLWNEYPENNNVDSTTVAFHQLGTSSTGICSFAPSFAGRLSISIHVEDSLGRKEFAYAPSVIVTGGEYTSPVLINISTDKATYAVGDQITVNYSITGGTEEYNRIVVMCQETATGSNAAADVYYSQLTEKAGTVVFSPPFSGTITIYFLVYDSLNRVTTGYAPSITIIQEQDEIPLTISIRTNKTRIRVGESVTVYYEVSGGSGTYERVDTLWQEKATGSITDSTVASSHGTEAIGSYTFIPDFTGTISVTVHVTDSVGRKSFAYAPQIYVPSINDLLVDIPMLPVDFELPVSLLTVSEGAFSKTKAKCVKCSSNTIEILDNAFSNCSELEQIIIPNRDTRIANNAFDGCDRIVIFCKKDSEALAFARNNMFDYCIIE